MSVALRSCLLDRRTFFALVSGGLFAQPVLTAAQQLPARTWRLGLLSAGVRLPQSIAQAEIFHHELRERGYIEGRTYIYKHLWADGHFDRLPDLAAELVQWNPDVLVAMGGTPAALAMKKLTTTIPIVVVTAVFPVEMGLIASLAHPGGNVTGITLDAASGEISKRLQIFAEVVPKGRTVFAILNPAFPGMMTYWKNSMDVARQLGIRLEAVEVRDPSADIFSTLGGRAIGGLLIVLDQVVAAQGKQIVDTAMKMRWPTMFVGPSGKGFVEAGGLMVYSASQEEHFRKAAIYVDKILKGAKPADLPMEQPTRFELVINLKTAKAIGLNVPQSVLLQANELIQ
jgi:putative ABC transport system substrate-binding protein